MATHCCITHLALSRMICGKIKVSKSGHDPNFQNVVTIWGSSIIEPPAQPLSDRKFAKWQTRLIENGYEFGWTPNENRLRASQRRPTWHRSTSQEELRNSLAPAVVPAMISSMKVARESFHLFVANIYQVAIPAFSLAVVYHHENPQPNPMIPVLGPHVHTVHEPVILRYDEGGYESDIQPDDSVMYYLSFPTFRAAQSRAASLSSENLRLSLRFRGHEYAYIRGHLFADWLTEERPLGEAPIHIVYR